MLSCEPDTRQTQTNVINKKNRMASNSIDRTNECYSYWGVYGETTVVARVVINTNR